MAEKVKALEKLLVEAGKAHHEAHLRTGLDNPDWADWYAGFLVENINQLLGTHWTRNELAARLDALDRAYRAADRALRWPRYYAEMLLPEE